MAAAPRGQTARRFRVSAKKLPVSALLIENDKRRIESGHPVEQKVVRYRHAFFDVVRDEVIVGVGEKASARPAWPEMAGKDLQLKCKVEKVVLAAQGAVPVGGPLDVVKDCLVFVVADPRVLEPARDFRGRKTDEGGLIDVIDELTVEAALQNREPGKRALFHERPRHPRHEVLCGFEGEESWRSVFVEACLGRDERPEPKNHATRQAADRDDLNGAADVILGRLPVGIRQPALGQEDENR